MISQKIVKISPQTGQRTAYRWRQYKVGKIFSSESTLPVDCIVRDASSSGSRLTVLSPSTLPKKFTLLNLSDGVERRCKVVWRGRNSIGVRFV